MHRLLDGDPLGLEDRALVRRDELAYLVSTTRVFYRAAAQVAFDACAYGVTEPQDAWVDASIDKGIEGILEDEEAEHRVGASVDPDEEMYYDAVTDLLDVSIDRARGVCIAFNSLPFAARSAYFEYTRMRTSAGPESPGSGSSLKADLAKALVAILTVGGALQ